MGLEILLLVVLPLILLVAIIWSIFDVIHSDMETPTKAIWIVLLLAFSFIALLAWLWVRHNVK